MKNVSLKYFFYKNLFLNSFFYGSILSNPLSSTQMSSKTINKLAKTLKPNLVLSQANSNFKGNFFVQRGGFKSGVQRLNLISNSKIYSNEKALFKNKFLNLYRGVFIFMIFKNSCVNASLFKSLSKDLWKSKVVGLKAKKNVLYKKSILLFNKKKMIIFSVLRNLKKKFFFKLSKVAQLEKFILKVDYKYKLKKELKKNRIIEDLKLKESLTQLIGLDLTRLNQEPLKQTKQAFKSSITLNFNETYKIRKILIIYWLHVKNKKTNHLTLTLQKQAAKAFGWLGKGEIKLTSSKKNVLLFLRLVKKFSKYKKLNNWPGVKKIFFHSTVNFIFFSKVNFIFFSNAFFGKDEKVLPKVYGIILERENEGVAVHFDYEKFFFSFSFSVVKFFYYFKELLNRNKIFIYFFSYFSIYFVTLLSKTNLTFFKTHFVFSNSMKFVPFLNCQIYRLSYLLSCFNTKHLGQSIYLFTKPTFSLNINHLKIKQIQIYKKFKKTSKHFVNPLVFTSVNNFDKFFKCLFLTTGNGWSVPFKFKKYFLQNADLFLPVIQKILRQTLNFFKNPALPITQLHLKPVRKKSSLASKEVLIMIHSSSWNKISFHIAALTALFKKLNNLLFKYLFYWAKNQHQNNNNFWIFNKYWLFIQPFPFFYSNSYIASPFCFLSRKDKKIVESSIPQVSKGLKIGKEESRTNQLIKHNLKKTSLKTYYLKKYKLEFFSIFRQSPERLVHNFEKKNNLNKLFSMKIFKNPFLNKKFLLINKTNYSKTLKKDYINLYLLNETFFF